MPKERYYELGIRNPYIDLEPFLAEEIKDTDLHLGNGREELKFKDSEVYENVCEALYRNHEITTNQIIIIVKDGEVTLSGQVPDEHMKDSVEATVKEVPGVFEIYNELQINDSDQSLNVSNH